MWFDVAGHRVHGWRATPDADDRLQGGVAIVPGLGLPPYTFPTARAVAARGLTCTVLDLRASGPTGSTPPSRTSTRWAGPPRSGWSRSHRGR